MVRDMPKSQGREGTGVEEEEGDRKGGEEEEGQVGRIRNLLRNYRACAH